MLAAGGSALDATAARMFLCIAVVVVVGRLVGTVFRRFGQPAVLGEILAGIALGPSLLGLLPGDLTERLFPGEVRPFLRVIAELGLVVFMFLVGLEVDPATLRRSSRRAAAISLSSIAVPFLLGLAVLGPVLHGRYGTVEGSEVRFVPFGLFLGVAMSGTAFAVLARILTERRMFRLPLGMLAIACAAIDDVVVFSLLTVVISLAGSAELSAVPLTLGQLVVFVAVLFGVVRPLLDRFLLSRYRASGRLGADVLALLLACLMGAAWVSHEIGLAALIGAFLFGAAMPRRGLGHLPHELSERLEGISVVLLLPVFFVVTGLDVDVGGLGVAGIGPLLLIIAVACVGKFSGGGVAARLSGIPTRQALALGTLMNTRGLTELVILNIGRSAGLIEGDLFTMMVVMAVLTTVMAGPLLGVVYPERMLQRDIADAERRRDAGAAQVRVALVATGSHPELGPALVGTALALTGGQRPAEVQYLDLVAAPSGELAGAVGQGFAAVAPRMVQAQAGRAGVESPGVRWQAEVRQAADPVTETAELVRTSGADLVVVGWDGNGTALLEALAGLDVDLMVAAGLAATAEISDSPRSDAAGIALRGGGAGRDGGLATEVAARLARSWSVPVDLAGAERSGRIAGQLERAGLEVSAGAVGTVDPAHQLVVDVLPLSDGRLGAAGAAAAAGARQPTLLVRARSGDRRPLADALGPPAPGAAGPGGAAPDPEPARPA
jgi:Kef-type K+ transport system membrane component KefB